MTEHETFVKAGKEKLNDEFITVRCPRCAEKRRKFKPGKIGEYRGIPSENLEVGFWCRECKMSILIKWVKTCAGYVITWRVRG